MIEKLVLTIILFAIIFWSIFIIIEVKTNNKIKHLKKGIEDLKKELER